MQKKGTRNFKPLKKNRSKPGRTIIIDLTGDDDDEMSVPCKVKRKKTKRNLKCLKSKQKIQKHINPMRSILSNRIADGSISVTNKPSSSPTVHHINLQKTEHLNTTKSKITSNACSEFGKEDENISHCLKSSISIDGQNVKEFKSSMNVSKESKPETCASSHTMYMTENTPNLCTINSYNNPIMQAFISQDENAMDAIPVSKMCQDSIAEQPTFKQELPTSMNGNVMQKSHKCCETMPDMHDMHDIKHLIIKELKSINEHNSQITKIINQKECHQVNECPNHCSKIDCKPIVFINNDVTAAKAQDILDDDVKLACDTNIIYMLSGRNKCVYVVNHIGKHVMTVHTEKRVQRLDKPSDTRTIPTPKFAGDQVIESPLCNQHVNLNNVPVNDYGSAAKYSEATMKEQPLLCPYIVQCGEVPPNLFKYCKLNYPGKWIVTHIPFSISY